MFDMTWSENTMVGAWLQAKMLGQTKLGLPNPLGHYG
jgi:hypothetical protein